MITFKAITRSLLMLFAIMLLNNNNAFAQSSSTDVLSKGQTYLEASFWTGLKRHDNGGSEMYGGRLARGIAKGVEVGVNGSGSDPNNPDFPVELQPNIKWNFYNNETNGVAAAGGAIAYLPLVRREGTDTFVMVYTNVSKRLQSLREPRLTVGGYLLTGRNRDFGTRRGLNLMYEQPITSRISFSAQWITGKNRFGYLTPGFTIITSKRSFLYAGYSIGNERQDNHGPYLSYGFTF